MTFSKLTFFIMMVLVGVFGALSNPINSTVANENTPVPFVYRAVIGLILIVLVIFAVWKFFRLLIDGLFAFLILLIIVSTTYYFFKEDI